ncbi:MAG: hypothetical protein RLZZ298_2978 [Pseudomonadota bacterium]|jgi:hypothetical protein
MFEFLQSIADFFTTGIYAWFMSAIAYVMESALVWYFELKISTLTFAWNIAKNVLTALHLSTQLQTSMSSLPPSVASGIAFFRVPEAINMIMSAGVTRLVLRYMPF